MNYFISKEAAERYAIGRPPFHANTIKHISNFLQLKNKLGTALDVACGTGLSTRALTAIAGTVYGTDASPAMLDKTTKENNTFYQLAQAEKQPFGDNSIDLITVSSGVHWFNIDAFLREANRLLKSRGWLIMYENHFIGQMENAAAFHDWFFNVYLKRYPSPPRRHDYDWSNENLNPRHFTFAAEEKFNNTISFTQQQLILYFTTQSNIISAVEKKITTFEDAEKWLADELSKFFHSNYPAREIQFGNWIKYLQKNN